MLLAESEGLIESLPMITWGNDQNTRIRSYLGELLFIITCLHEIKGVFDERIFPLIQLLLAFSYRLLYSTTLVFLHSDHYIYLGHKFCSETVKAQSSMTEFWKSVLLTTTFMFKVKLLYLITI